jgi:protein involved in polysaccharide export with SLBB domain
MNPLAARLFWVLGLASVLSCPARYSINPIQFQGGPVVNLKTVATLDAGDVFDVRVYGEQDLSGTYRISEQGQIRFPLVGLVRVAGLTATEIEDRLRAELQKGFLRSPQVTVFVREFNSKKIFIFGEVAKPGTFAYEPNMNIIQAITIAGGFTRTAWRNRTNVTRIVNGEEQKIQVPVEAIGEGTQKNFALKPGDIIFVPESPL